MLNMSLIQVEASNLDCRAVTNYWPPLGIDRGSMFSLTQGGHLGPSQRSQMTGSGFSRRLT